MQLYFAGGCSGHRFDSHYGTAYEGCELPAASQPSLAIGIATWM